MKRIISLLLIFLLSLALFGCDGNIENGGNGGNGNEGGGDGSAYVEIDDEDVKSITVFKNDWADFNNARKNNTPIYQQLKSKINCDIEALNASSGNWETHLSLLQADEDLPDIFLTNGPDNSFFFDKLIKNEDILPISDWVSEEHYPNIYNYLKQFEFLRSNVTYGKGKMWFIPSTWHLEKSLYVRTDWIDNLNAKLDSILVLEGIVNSASEITPEIREQWKFKYPETLLEFYRLARAFTKYDPDGNGQHDTTGYVSESNKDMDAWIYIAFDAGWRQFIKEGDKYALSDISENSMYATAFVTRLIAEGYMSIDSLTGDIETKQSRFMNGKAGMMYAHNWYNVIVSGMMAAQGITMDQAVDKIAMIAPPKGKNGTFGGDGPKGFWQGFCINANMSNARIRKCLEFYDYLLSEEGYKLLQHGVEGVQWKENADGTKQNLLPVDEDGFIQSINVADPASLLYALVDWTMSYNNELTTNSHIINPRQAHSERNSNFDDYPSVTTPLFVEHFGSSHKLFLESISQFQKNERNVFYDPSDETDYNPKTFGWDDLYTVSRTFKGRWNTYVDNYLKNYYGQQVIDEYNAFIDSGKAKKVSADDYIFNSKLE